MLKASLSLFKLAIFWFASAFAFSIASQARDISAIVIFLWFWSGGYWLEDCLVETRLCRFCWLYATLWRNYELSRCTLRKSGILTCDCGLGYLMSAASDTIFVASMYPWAFSFNSGLTGLFFLELLYATWDLGVWTIESRALFIPDVEGRWLSILRNCVFIS